MKFKRGEFTGEAVSIVIAVIGLALILIVAGVIIYSNVTEEQRAAKKTIDSIIGKIGNLGDGETGRFAVQGFKNSKEWYLVSFDLRDKLDDRPGRCAFESCLCICKGSSKNSCQDDGFCRFFDDKEINVETEPFETYIPNQAGGQPVYLTQHRACISFFSSLQELIVVKADNEVNVSRELNLESPLFYVDDLWFSQCKKVS